MTASNIVLMAIVSVYLC